MAVEDTYTVQTGDAGKQGGEAGEIPRGNAASFYEGQTSNRQPFLDRARRLAAITAPALFPPEGSKGADAALPWNSIGAYLLFNLGAKVSKSMFPIGLSPIKLAQDRRTRRDLAQMEAQDPAGAQKIKTEIDEGLSIVEQEFSECMEEDGDRARLNVGILKMLVGGNHALQFYPDGTLRGISMERFVTQRDPSGKLLRWCIKDPMTWATLPPDVKEIALRHGYSVSPDQVQQPEICVYTQGQLMDGRWRVYQETYSEVVEGTTTFYDDESTPYVFLPWFLLPGEDYARSYCEHYESDLDLVDGLTKTIAQGSAALARFITMVSPTGLTSKKQLAEADNGDVITGRDEDVHVLQGEKSADFNTADNTNQQTAQRLARAFLVTSAVVRQAERVTAQEVHQVAQELEEVLGSVYSEQVVTFQTPYARKKIRYLIKQGRVTNIPMSSIQLKVIGGAAALGRNAQLIALDQYVGGALQTLGPQMVLQAINPREYMNRRAAALGIETANLVYTEEEAQQATAQAQQQEMIKTFGPQMLSSLGQYRAATDTAEINADAKLATQGAPAPPTVQ